MNHVCEPCEPYIKVVEERNNIVDAILSEREKQTALDIIDCLRRGDMMAEALEVLSKRFAIRAKVIADWYYSIRR